MGQVAAAGQPVDQVGPGAGRLKEWVVLREHLGDAQRLRTAGA